jgi:hypothetical protein
MYVDTATVKSGKKTFVRHLLRTSFRQNGKVCHKTLLNLSGCSNDEVAALKLALKHKGALNSLTAINDIDSVSGKRIGAVWALNVVAARLHLAKTLGSHQNGKLALLQVMARLINQGSRLSAVRLAKSHALCEILGIDRLDENDLYGNLVWIAEHQESIEKKLFSFRFPNATPTLFLYDVTSSYLEGTENELGRFGYNRDGKKSKMQIVVGLLCGPDGLPVAVRVFEGNTNDTKTVSEQIRILAHSFGVKEVTLVGDRGMLKGPQIEALPEDFRYITAISKPQIVTMLTTGVLQIELFSNQVCEVERDGIRYVLRRNPVRAQQMSESRIAKHRAILKAAQVQNEYLSEHPRAVASVALNKITSKIKGLKANGWLCAIEKERKITISQDEFSLANAALLDGCYVIKSDIPKSHADTQSLHDRYCDLENVERAFRTMKNTHLELRPIYVRKKASTKGHVFVVMLALLLQRELERCWSELNLTVDEGIDELGAIHTEEIRIGGTIINHIPKPNERAAKILAKASVVLPKALPQTHARVHTIKKLHSERIR